MFKTKLQIEHIENTVLYRLTSPLVYVTWEGVEHIVPENFTTDGHSYPPLLRSILGSPFASKNVEAAVYHDWLCMTKIVSRREADSEYSHAMADLKTPVWKRKRNYLGVRIGAVGSWISRLWKRNP